MNQKHFYMGAINKATDEYVFPINALKKDKYICPFCETDIIFKCGKKRANHYSHKPHSNCCYYTRPSESQIHKDGKRLMKKFLDDRQKLFIWRHCNCCDEDVEVLTLNNYSDDMKCVEEFAFKHNERNCSGDVVLTKSGKEFFIFEIFKTHRTDEVNRPHDKWVEINAEELILRTMEQRNINDEGEIEIECVRDILCDECDKKKQAELDKKEADKKRHDAECIKIMNCEQEAIRTGKWDVVAWMKIFTHNELVYKIGPHHHTIVVSNWASEIIEKRKREKQRVKERREELLRCDEEYKIREEARRIKQLAEYARAAKRQRAIDATREETLQDYALQFIWTGRIKALHRLRPSMLGKFHYWRRDIKKELLIWFPPKPTGGIHKFVRNKSIAQRAKANRAKRVALYKARY